MISRTPGNSGSRVWRPQRARNPADHDELTPGAHLAQGACVRFVPLALLVAACADAPPTPAPAGGDDLPLGDVDGDLKADGNGWGSALDCKPIPQLDPLVAPTITVSLDGLTLHLVDTATGYDRVFPIGPGRVDQTKADSECNFSGGFCATNHTSHTGFCSAHCTQYCSDRTGYPSTFCVADPDHAGQGMCMPKAQDQNYECRPYDHFAVAHAHARFNQ